MASVTTQEAADAIRTNRQGRAALGIAAEAIKRGYEVIDTIEPGLLRSIFSTGLIGYYFEDQADSEVRQAGRDLLDQANAYAGGIYAVIPDDDNPIDGDTRKRVALALSTAEKDLGMLNEAQASLTESYLDELGDLVQAIEDAASAVAEKAAAAAEYIADKAKKVADALIPTWLKWTIGIGVVVIAGAVAWRYTRP